MRSHLGYSCIGLAVALAMGAGCGDDAQPTTTTPIPTTAHPLVGTYDVTTVLTSFSFETGSPSPPDCTSSGPYCTHIRPNTAGATLDGTLVVEDTVVSNSAGRFLILNGTFTGRFCDSIDTRTLTGCTRVGPPTVISYPLGGIDLTGDTLKHGSVRATSSSAPPHIEFWDVVYGKDSLSGRLDWAMTINRSPPTYRGTFVARRRTVQR